MIEKEEMSFYLKQNGKIEYNKKCNNCPEKCKQSFRAEILSCPKLKEEEKKDDT